MKLYGMRREDKVRLLLITYHHGQPGPVGSSLGRGSRGSEGWGPVLGAVWRRSASYEPLEKALVWLQHARPDLHRAVWDFYVDDRPLAGLVRSATEGVNLLTARMPLVIRVPRDVAANAEVLLKRRVRY